MFLLGNYSQELSPCEDLFLRNRGQRRGSSRGWWRRARWRCGGRRAYQLGEICPNLDELLQGIDLRQLIHHLSWVDRVEWVLGLKLGGQQRDERIGVQLVRRTRLCGRRRSQLRACRWITHQYIWCGHENFPFSGSGRSGSHAQSPVGIKDVVWRGQFSAPDDSGRRLPTCPAGVLACLRRGFPVSRQCSIAERIV
jgi:hypothetical protein